MFNSIPRLLFFCLAFLFGTISLAQPTSKTIMVTVKHGSAEDEIKNYFNQNGLAVSRPFQRFEQTDPDTGVPLATKSGVYLGDYWRVELPKASSVQAWIIKLRREPWVKNAEYDLGYALLNNTYTPNDSNLGSQWYLNTAHFPEAWTISKGDSNFVVGIVDTGIEPAHPDLSANIWVNAVEVNGVAGVDDDQNGYTDDLSGFNFAQSGGNHDGQGHGSFVAGVTGAVTDNVTGIAGSGFDCQMMSLRVYNSTNGRLSGTLEAVLYAAQNGAKIINLSLGRSGFPADWEEDIFNYVILDKDVLVIAAAGNRAQNTAAPEEDFYPASYKNVLSVGAINSSKQRAGNYVISSKMDIVAPGFGIYSTYPTWAGTGGYLTANGTSFAAPLAAGAGVLVRSTFPQLSARQAKELIRVTTDDHYGFGSNASYEGYFGKGSLNAHRALTYEDSAISVRLEDFELLDVTSINDSTYELTVYVDFINFLNSVSRLSVMASPELNSVTMVDSLISVAQLSMGEHWEDQVFRFRVHCDQLGQDIRLRLDYSGKDSLYTDYEYLDVPVDRNYLRARMNQFDFALTNIGRMGYLDANYFEGYGMYFGGNLIAREAGLFVAASPAKVSDGLLEDYANNILSQDFTADTTKFNPSLRLVSTQLALRELRAAYTDTLAANPIGVQVRERIRAWDQTNNDNYLIWEYEITNAATQTLDSLRIGIFWDFDLPSDALENVAGWDNVDDFGYVRNADSTLWFAVKLLNADSLGVTPRFKGVNLDIAAYPHDPYDGDGFTSSDKFHLLSNTITSETTSGNIFIASGAHFTNWQAGQTKTLQFLIVGDTSYQRLKEAFVQEISVSASGLIQVLEDTQTTDFIFQRSGILLGDITVNFSVSGTAEASDYVLSGATMNFDASTQKGTVVIPEGQSEAVIRLTPTPDTDIEPDETIIMTILPY